MIPGAGGVAWYWHRVVPLLEGRGATKRSPSICPAASRGEPLQRRQADRVFGDAWRFERWPDVPIHVIAGADDRFFPVAFQARVARELVDRLLAI